MQAGGVCLDFREASFSWVSSEAALSPHREQTAHLENLSFTIAPGTLLGIVGPVGAGKSTLLNSILGETAHLSGEIYIDPFYLKGAANSTSSRFGFLSEPGFGYAAQEAWIQHLSVKECVNTSVTPINHMIDIFL